MAFLDENYLLTSATAADLYAQIRDLPVIDAHNHADVKALAENKNFTDIWQVEAATDHYVWECLRKRGVPEELITGEKASNREKWLALAEVFTDLVGNPTFEWVHLDLQRMLGIDDLVCAENGSGIWDQAEEILARPEMTPRSLLQAMNVEAMCSTDDPVDSLEYHQQLQDSEIKGVVRPTFRPDRAMNIFKPDWRDYMQTLEARVNSRFSKIADLIAALGVTHDYFAENGCVASDHGVNVPYAYQIDEQTADQVFRKAYRDGAELSEREVVAFMSYVLNEVAEMDAQKGWVFQLHLGAVRDARRSLAEQVGPDSGGDISDNRTEVVQPLLPLLNRFDNRLKVVIYHLNPIHMGALAHLTRAFGEQVNLGVAWWLNDSYIGMKRQLEYVGTVDTLMNLGGMVSDSRKLLSYASRHEMFRRTLADTVGSMVNLGQMPMELAGRLVRHVSYERPKTLFGL